VPHWPERIPSISQSGGAGCSFGGGFPIGTLVTCGRIAHCGDRPDRRIEWGELGRLCSWCEDPEAFQPPHLGEHFALQRGEQAVVARGGGGRELPTFQDPEKERVSGSSFSVADDGVSATL
jgi:hypothetical protein